VIGHLNVPRFLNDDINTPEILKLRARFFAILMSRDYHSLTSVMPTAATHRRDRGGTWWQTQATADKRS